jgi:hypothetical protein
MQTYKYNYAPKKLRTETREQVSKPVSKIATIKRRTIITLKTLVFLTVVAGSLRVYYPFFCEQLDTCVPEIKAETTYVSVNKETEEEADLRRTEEILSENFNTYWNDARKKMLEEKSEKIRAMASSTAELSPSEAKKVIENLNRADAHLTSGPKSE